MSNKTDWKYLGKKQGANMKNFRNMKLDKIDMFGSPFHITFDEKRKVRKT